MVARSRADTNAAQAAGATSAAQHLDTSTNRAQDVDKDTGTDERYEVETADRSAAWFSNTKRTYDLHQTLDTDKFLDKGKHQAKLDSMEMAEREQRMRHTEAEHNQRMRHADRDHSNSSTVMVALLGDMAEKLGMIMQNTSKV